MTESRVEACVFYTYCLCRAGETPPLVLTPMTAADRPPEGVGASATGLVIDEEIDRMGESLCQLEEKIDELCAIFGLERAALAVDLGPLGNIL